MQKSWNRRLATLGLALPVLLLGTARSAHADEGGVSFWMPGSFADFAATQLPPGFSLPVVYYHYSGWADGDVELPRGGTLSAGLSADADLMLFVPTYTLKPQVLGGQLTLSIAEVLGTMEVGVDGTLTDPAGDTWSGEQTDIVTGFGDLYPSGSLSWNYSTLSFLWYVMGGIPLGSYGVDRLANLGTNHWSLDSGTGITWFPVERGFEFSAVVGTTYNADNPATGYQNGISVHVDAAMSQFLTETFHVGITGYVYNQLTGDSAPEPLPSGITSSVYALGPEFGWFFDVGGYQPYVNFKAYYEFQATARTEGFDLWAVLAIPFSKAEP